MSTTSRKGAKAQEIRLSSSVVIVKADCRDLVGDWDEACALVSDPPYGMGYVSNHNSGRGFEEFIRKDGDFDPIMGDDEPFNPLPFLGFEKVCLWGAQHYSSKLPDRRGWLVWDKLAGKTPCDSSDVELAWTNQDVPARIFTHLWRGLMRAGEENIVNSPKLHPNQKPVALMAWSLRVLGVTGLVRDPFMGSGSLGVACIRAGLPYYGVEADPVHFETARRRLERELAQPMLPMTGSHRGPDFQQQELSASAPPDLSAVEGLREDDPEGSR